MIVTVVVAMVLTKEGVVGEEDEEGERERKREKEEELNRKESQPGVASIM